MRTKVIAIAVAGATLAAGGTAVAASPPASLPRTQVTGSQMINRFMRNLQQQDSAKVKALLAPSFIVQRANGTWETKASYLAALPKVTTYVIGSSVSAYSSGTLTVRWEVSTAEVVPGAPVGTGMEPRLSTFTWTPTGFRMTSHGNFNPPA